MSRTARTAPETPRRLPPAASLLTLFLMVLLSGLVLLVNACEDGASLGLGDSIRGSGDLQTEDYAFDGFSELEIGYAFAVTVIESDTYGVSVTVDDNILEWLEVEQSGDVLKIGIRNTPRAPRLTAATLKATVSMPELHGLDASGASKISLSGFSSVEELSLGVSGASAVTGEIEAGDVRFELSGASKIELEGSASDLIADVSGASHLLLEDFVVTNADVGLSGASSCTLNMSGRLDAALSGGSELRYIGEPTLGDIEIGHSSSLKRQ